ncbi:MAG: ParB/RepB/Spo0J family partition protein [bacterium]|nr:ParB/RepB/Spo0J family partition protein [bacterium]
MQNRRQGQTPPIRLSIQLIDPRDDGCVDVPAGAELRALAESIRRDGLIQPLLVRPTATGRYQIVQGNRRLMACRMLGMEEVDASVLPISAFDSEARRMLDDLHSGGLHYLQVAAMLQSLHTVHGMTEEALARQLAMPVESVHQKLELMSLGQDIRAALTGRHLPERLALSLLRLPDDETRRGILQQMIDDRLNIRDTELLIGSVQRQLQGRGGSGRTLTVIRDERLYLNAIRTLVTQMQEAGLQAELCESDVAGCLELRVRVSHRRRRSARYHEPHIPGKVRVNVGIPS